MRISRPFVSAIASALLLAVAAPGCSDDSDAADDAIDDGNERGNELAGETDEMLESQDDRSQIALGASIVLTIDQGEVAVANAALEHTTNADVRAFATLMVTEHTAHAAAVTAAIGALQIEPIDNAVSAQLRAEGEAAIRTLESSGDPDRAYIEGQVRMHEEARVIVDAIADHVDDDTVHDFLVDTLGVIETHRDHAADLLRDL